MTPDPPNAIPDDASDGLADAWFWGAIAVALLLRLAPLLLSGVEVQCSRDECIYGKLADQIVEGMGLQTSKKGWLAAPGYPYLLALSQLAFGAKETVKYLQLAVSCVTVWLMYRIGWRVGGGRPTARVAAWSLALHPTFAFFVGTLWTETVYAFLLLCSVLALLWSRDEDAPWWSGALSGMALGGCVLFRGVATYLGPVFLLAALWPEQGGGWRALRDSVRQRWRRGLILVAAMVFTVAPYSLYASPRHGGFMVSDATVGHVIYLGNNVFEPITFDYGNGMLASGLYNRTLREGRHPCSRRVPPVQSSHCEVKNAVSFIAQRPGLFLSRVPLRLAQLFNPHSFFTRHLRWGNWSSWVPWWLEEILVLWICGTTIAITLGGTAGAYARARGVFGVIAVGTILYHLAVIGSMYGMTRFRLPLEPFWMIYLAMVVADPRGTLTALRASWRRTLGLVLTLPMLCVLLAWFFPTGWPGWW